MNWRKWAILFLILAVGSAVGSLVVGLYMSFSINQLPLPSSYEEAIPYHLIEIRDYLDEIQGLIYACLFLLAAIFCALMDIGNRQHGKNLS